MPLPMLFQRLLDDLASVGPHNLTDADAQRIVQVTIGLEQELGTMPEWDSASPEEDRCSIDRRRDDAVKAVCRYLLQSLDVDGLGGCRLCSS